MLSAPCGRNVPFGIFSGSSLSLGKFQRRLFVPAQFGVELNPIPTDATCYSIRGSYANFAYPIPRIDGSNLELGTYLATLPCAAAYVNQGIKAGFAYADIPDALTLRHRFATGTVIVIPLNRHRIAWLLNKPAHTRTQPGGHTAGLRRQLVWPVAARTALAGAFWLVSAHAPNTPTQSRGGRLRSAWKGTCCRIVSGAYPTWYIDAGSRPRGLQDRIVAFGVSFSE